MHLRPHDLRPRISLSITRLASLALLWALTACGERETNDAGTQGGVTTDPSGSSDTDPDPPTTESGAADTSSTSEASEASEASEVESGDPEESGTDTSDTDPSDTDPSTTDEPKLDMPAPPDGDCTVTMTEASTLDDHPECPIELLMDLCWSELFWGCVTPEPGQSCEELCPEGDCVDTWMNCAGDEVWTFPEQVCGPYERDGMCCSLANIIVGCAE